MDVKRAVLECLPFIKDCDKLPDNHPEFGKDHLQYMVDTMLDMECPNTEEKRRRLKEIIEAEIFGDLPHHEPSVDAAVEQILAMMKPCEKSMRWLGWLQACLVFGGGTTLEDMKRINKES